MPEDVKHRLNTATGVQSVLKTTIVKPVGTRDDGCGFITALFCNNNKTSIFNIPITKYLSLTEVVYGNF